VLALLHSTFAGNGNPEPVSMNCLSLAAQANGNPTSFVNKYQRMVMKAGIIRRYGAHFVALTGTMLLGWCLISVDVTAQAGVTKNSKETVTEGETAGGPGAVPAGPVDEFDRGVPRTTVEGFLDAVQGGDFERAAHYLDLRNIPRSMEKMEGPELARQLKIVLDRALRIDLELVSSAPRGNLEDGLPEYRESLGRIQTPERTVDLFLQRIPREDRVFIWKFSNKTIAEIPYLYEHFGYRPFEEKVSNLFPHFVLLGWETWQWLSLLVLIVLSYIAAWIPTWCLGLILRRKDDERSRELSRLVTVSIRVLLWVVIIFFGIHIIGPSRTLRSALEAGTLLIVAVVWVAIKFVDLAFLWLSGRMRERGQVGNVALLKPMRTMSKVIIVLLALLFWLDNIGFSIGTLLTGLGVGGIAIVLAVQDSLKNIIGSINIVLDKPFQVGERIVAKGHDGVVEEIGLRSTKMRLLTGHQASIPNFEMANADIENIGRRPHIRRLTNLGIAYDTPPEEVEKAVTIIQEILANNKEMDPEFPPRAYFNEFNRDSFNIMMMYWYYPADYWAFNAFNEKINLQIMKAFEREGIRLALPSATTYLAHDDHRPLKFSFGSNLHEQGRMHHDEKASGAPEPMKPGEGESHGKA